MPQSVIALRAHAPTFSLPCNQSFKLVYPIPPDLSLDARRLIVFISQNALRILDRLIVRTLQLFFQLKDFTVP